MQVIWLGMYKTPQCILPKVGSVGSEHANYGMVHNKKVELPRLSLSHNHLNLTLGVLE